MEAVSHFCDVRLGKEVVFARDTPNFIANRIGVFIMLEAVRLMQAEDLSIEEVDALTGTADRLAAHRNVPAGGPGGAGCAGARRREISRDPAAAGCHDARPFVLHHAGDGAGWATRRSQGFYKKEKDAEGKEVRLALDWKTLEYRPAAKPKLPSLEMAKNVEKLPERLTQLLAAIRRRTRRRGSTGAA